MSHTNMPNLVNGLRRYGVTVLPTALDWSGEASFTINRANVDVSWSQAQRYCEMLSAVREIGRVLWEIVPSSCRSRYTTAAELFQHIFGSINIDRVASTYPPGAPMQAVRQYLTNPATGEKSPAVIQVSNSGVSGTLRNCFYNVFMHEISHFVEYRWQFETTTLPDRYEQSYCRVEDRSSSGGCSQDGEVLRNTFAGFGFNMRSQENTEERITDAFANLFMDSFEASLDGQLRFEQMREFITDIACSAIRIEPSVRFDG
ncbi:hypothetical protein HC928_06595 [bacterium]|nr:hypothetical protein [bacterium]